MDIKDRKSIITLGVFLTVAVFVLGLYVVFPKLEKNKQRAAELQVEVDAAREEFESLEVAKAQMDEHQEFVDKVAIAVSESGNVDQENIIAELEAISLKHDLKIQSIGISEGSTVEEDATSSGNIVVSFSVEGDHDTLKSFLGSLETSVKFFNVDSLSMTSIDDGLVMSVSVEALTYTDFSQEESWEEF